MRPMLTRHDIERFLEGVQYKQHWRFEVYDTAHQPGPWLCIHFPQVDAYNPSQTSEFHVRSPLPMPLIRNRGDFLLWLKWRLELVEVHECHEFLRLNGKILYDPHAEGADQSA
jgi:hypothetical protein